jgi:hypothetical protein
MKWHSKRDEITNSKPPGPVNPSHQPRPGVSKNANPKPFYCLKLASFYCFHPKHDLHTDHALRRLFFI